MKLPNEDQSIGGQSPPWSSLNPFSSPRRASFWAPDNHSLTGRHLHRSGRGKTGNGSQTDFVRQHADAAVSLSPEAADAGSTPAGGHWPPEQTLPRCVQSLQPHGYAPGPVPEFQVVDGRFHSGKLLLQNGCGPWRCRAHLESGMIDQSGNASENLKDKTVQ